MPANFQVILFGGVTALAVLLGVLEWHGGRRGIALGAATLAAFAGAALALDRAAAHAIRVDLLVTIPLVSLAAVAVGVFGTLKPPFAARTVGAFLAAGGAVSLGWFVWDTAVWSRDAARGSAAYEDGIRLYWQETTRCQANFEKRFGPLRRHDSPCFGNLVVASRSAGAYPFARVVVNDEGRFDLLFTAALPAAENTFRLGDIPYGSLKPRPDGGLYIGRDPLNSQTAVELHPASNGACEARIYNDFKKTIDVYTLRRAELGPCPATGDPPVHFLGAWGSLVSNPPGSTYRVLTQVWLWETQGKGYALIACDSGDRGVYRPFNFVQRFTGVRNAEGVWQLRSEPPVDRAETVSVTIVEGRLRLGVTTDRLRGAREAVLDPADIITHPKIALVPVRDAALFERYFNSVLYNLKVPWTPQ